MSLPNLYTVESLRHARCLRNCENPLIPDVHSLPTTASRPRTSFRATAVPMWLSASSCATVSNSASFASGSAAASPQVPGSVRPFSVLRSCMLCGFDSIWIFFRRGETLQNTCNSSGTSTRRILVCEMFVAADIDDRAERFDPKNWKDCTIVLCVWGALCLLRSQRLHPIVQLTIYVFLGPAPGRSHDAESCGPKHGRFP